jgi:HK97 family phage portal protein
MMSIFSRAIGLIRKFMSPVDRRGGWWPVIRESFTGAWQRNVDLTGMDFCASPIVYACKTLISNDIGKIRAKLVQKDPDGIWMEVESGSPFLPVLRKPNRYQNHIQFKQWWIMSKLRHGNAYGLKVKDQRGVVTAIYILDPAVVKPLIAEDGSVYYQLSRDNLSGIRQESITVPASEIIHDRMNCLYHPLVGISPMYAAAIAAGISIKIQDNTLQFFANNAQPGGILVAPGAIDPENAAEIKDHWQTNYTGANAGKIAVIGDGMKFEPMAQNAVDSQLIETLRWSDERVCSVFHVPPYKVGVGAAPSYNNIEAQERNYYSNCLQSLIEEFEACMDEGLGLDGINKGVELDLDGLLRMDAKTQMETLKTAVDGAIYAPNEARQKLNRKPLEGGDTVYMQQQNYSLAALAARDKLNPLADPGPNPGGTVAEPVDLEDAQRVLAAFLTKELDDAQY